MFYIIFEISHIIFDATLGLRPLQILQPAQAPEGCLLAGERLRAVHLVLEEFRDGHEGVADLKPVCDQLKNTTSRSASKERT